MNAKRDVRIDLDLELSATATESRHSMEWRTGLMNIPRRVTLSWVGAEVGFGFLPMATPAIDACFRHIADPVRSLRAQGLVALFVFAFPARRVRRAVLWVGTESGAPQ
jgi:hypothetical protein